MEQIKETGCCKPFNPEPWQDKEITWDKKVFVKDRVSSFLHIPLNIGKKVTKYMELIEKAGALSDVQLMLFDENSLWGSDIYINVSKGVSGCNMAEISGIFLTKVFEGPYSQMGKWIREMNDFVKSKGKITKKLYFSYTTCPKCAKEYSKNYVVILAQIN